MTAFYVLQIISVARKDMVVAIAVATFTVTGGVMSVETLQKATKQVVYKTVY